jgi:hypothetical protein
MDDDFMTRCFDGNVEATELVLNIVLKMKLTVQRVTTQVHVKNLMGKSVILDIQAFGENGKCYNIEIQRAEKGAAPKRARYHSSMINVIKIGLAFLRLFENRGIKNMHNTSRNEKMAWQTGGTGPPKKNI